MTVILQAIPTLLAAFFGAWLAAWRFQRDKVWEKRLVSYSELVNALHKMKWTAGEHFDAGVESREIHEAESEQLWADFKTARRDAWRIAESSAFLLSTEVLDAMQKMESGLATARNHASWFEALDTEWKAIDDCLRDVKRIGAAHLNVRVPAHRAKRKEN